jgi:hypothetical protein
MEYILENWAALLLAALAFVDVIVSLTPSKKDDQILGYFRLVINAITGANKRKKKNIERR